MFRKLLTDLHKEFADTIYIPDALYSMVADWLCAQYNKDPRRITVIKWKGKAVLPYNEDKVLAAYQSCPIHIPERILEKSIVIETSLEPTRVPEPEAPKQQEKKSSKRILKAKKYYF